VFQVGTQAMSDSAWTQMKQLVADGVIGKPIFAETGYFRIGDTGERGMPVDNWDAQPGADLNWEAFLGDAPKRPFEVERFFQHRRFLDYAGGPCTDIYPHSLTPVVDILGVKFPEQVVASGGIYRYGQREVPDTFSLLIEYPEKLTIAVLGTIGNDYQNGGTRGSGQKIPVIRGHDGTLTVQGEEIVYLPLGTPNNKRKRETWPIGRPESLEYYWEQFLDAVRSRRRQTVSSVDLAYRAHTPLLMGMLSWRHGKAAKFDAEKEQIIGLN
jgi:predicted dehydrogenase